MVEINVCEAPCWWIIPRAGVVFLDQEQLTSMGVQEHMAPLLSHLLNSSSFSSPSPLLPGKWQLHIRNPACCILGLDIHKVSLQS